MFQHYTSFYKNMSYKNTRSLNKTNKLQNNFKNIGRLLSCEVYLWKAGCHNRIKTTATHVLFTDINNKKAE